MRKNTLLTTPKAGLSLATYAKQILELQSQADLWDYNLGRLNWLRGKLLLLAKKKCKHGQWGKFLASTGLSQSQSNLLRKIAELIPDKNSHRMSYSEMLSTIYPSFRKEIDQDGQDMMKSKGRKSGKVQLRIDQLGNRVCQLGNSTRKLLDCDWLDSHREPSETLDTLEDCLTTIAAAEKDLARIKKKINQRIGKLSSSKLRAVA